MAVLGVVATASTVVALTAARDGSPPAGDAAAAGVCARTVKVVTSTSFDPVLRRVAPALRDGPDCVALETTVVDGRTAGARVAERQADVWIPDDASWAATAPADLLAEDGAGGAGTVLATSPLYMVADKATAARLTAAGGSWLGLAGLLGKAGSGVTLTVRDPNSSGDGMVAAGALAEAVWLDRGMDASAMALSTALRRTRTVVGDGAALPAASGEVGLVPEYALSAGDRAPAGDRVLLPGTDHTALLRFSWQPTRIAVDTPEKAAALARLLTALKDAGPALTAARLRPPTAAALSASAPALSAKPFEVLGGHHVDHVFASWYVQDRRGSMLLVLDVSGSMADIAPGGSARLIDLVRQGCLAVGAMLPDQSSLGLWEFGSRLAPPLDYRTLLAAGPLTRGRRAALAAAVAELEPRTTGTGLYDTTLAAYKSAVAAYRPGEPNQVLVFTDGRNEDDPGSITAAQLAAGLKAAADPARPVQLTVVAYGGRPEVPVLQKAIEPVKGYLSKVSTAEQVAAAFVHVAAAGLH